MGLLSILKFIWTHPLARKNRPAAIKRFLAYQLVVRIGQWPILHDLTNHVKVIVGKGQTGVTGNIYTGLHEFHDMAFLLHFLRPGDLFVDVGANAGVYTLLASGHVGSTSVAIEPVPGTFRRLAENVQLNGLWEEVRMLNVAVGSESGTVWMTNSHDTMNFVMPSSRDEEGIEVQQVALDEVLQDVYPALIKIDVEGYELNVLQGADLILGGPSVQALIVELNESGGRYHQSSSAVVSALRHHGFEPFRYDPYRRIFLPGFEPRSSNGLFIRDIGKVRERVLGAPLISLMGVEF